MGGHPIVRGDEARHLAESIALEAALLDALSDLVRLLGEEFLDGFLERRVALTEAELRIHAEMRNSPEIANQLRVAEQTVRRVVEAARTPRLEHSPEAIF